MIGFDGQPGLCYVWFSSLKEVVKMNRKSSFFFLGFVTVSLVGGGIACVPEDEPVHCPTCAEVMSWDTAGSARSSYGELSMKSGKDDSYAWQILETCPDWSIYEGHRGGTGATLEIVSCDEGVVLEWAFNEFWSVHLSQGWAGKTSTGMAIGSSYEDFIRAYPGYEDSGSTNLLVYPSGIAFFEDGLLVEVTVR
ncbi:MAG: hypothetical protein RDU25_05440 [Patescibacteria group bacterium]|nr:hypothetical protein [Patescibacteria group bacterium]